MACEWAPVYVVPVNEVPANGVYEREPCSGGVFLYRLST